MIWQSMPAFEELLTIDDRPSVVTVGNFDGVHLGHQYLLSTVTDQTKLLGLRSIAITFEPHPVQILRPQHPFYRIVAPKLKYDLIKECGIDEIVVIRFDQDFAALTPREFLDVLYEATTPKAIIVGEGFKFGYQRSGDGGTIRSYGKSHGFKGMVIDRLENGDGIISSSAIRKYIAEGNVSVANLALGRRFSLQGRVKEGVARGRELGYPTANLHIGPNQLSPLDGVYAAYSSIIGRDEKIFNTMVYIGASPTFGDVERQIEAHLLDYTGDLYANELNLEFVEFIRSDKEFGSVADLVAQIADDEHKTRELLIGTTPESRSGAKKQW